MQIDDFIVLVRIVATSSDKKEQIQAAQRLVNLLQVNSATKSWTITPLYLAGLQNVINNFRESKEFEVLRGVRLALHHLGLPDLVGEVKAGSPQKPEPPDNVTIKEGSLLSIP